MKKTLLKRKLLSLSLLAGTFFGLNNANAQVYLAEGFSSATGITPPAGWSNTAGPLNTVPTQVWSADNPGTRTVTGADFSGKFFILDSDFLGNGFTQDARLTTPSINLSASTLPILTYSEQFRSVTGIEATLEYSVNGGSSWTALVSRSASYGYPNPSLRTTMTVPGAAGQANVQFRWRYNSTYGWWWAIDSVIVREAVAPTAPINLTFTSVSASGLTVNWVDNSTNETNFRVYRSTDNVNFTLANTVTSTSVGTTGNAYTSVETGLNAGTTYYYKIAGFGDVESLTPLTGSQLTSPPGVILSASGGGNWNDVNTWVGGAIPTATDSVVIVDGAIVTVNSTTAVCHSITVGTASAGVLTYAATPAATLTVNNVFYVNAGGAVNPGVGTLATHALRIGGTAATNLRSGSLIVNGSFDLSDGTAGVVTTFFGQGDAVIGGTPAMLDFHSVIINKGAVAVNRPVLDIQAPFTVQGANTVGLITTHTAGVVKISGSFTQTNPLYTTAGYTIPANGGLWLNNANFTVAATSGSPTCNGLLRISSGTYNVSQLATQVLGFGTGAVFTVEGGVVNAAARILSANTITFNMSAGVINVATVGNSTSNSASFGLTSGTTTINWTGGVVNLVQRSTGSTILDYNVAPIAGYNGGTVQVGTAATATNFDFRISGNVPDLIIDSANNAKTAVQTTQVNYWRNIRVTTGATLRLNGFVALHVGQNMVNNGFVDGRTTSSNFVFYQNPTGHTYSGTGVDTLATFACQDTAVGTTFDKPVVAYRVNFLSKRGFINSNNITLGNGLTQAVTTQYGDVGLLVATGSYDVAPNFNMGTGNYSLIYQQEGAMRTMGFEVPVSRNIFNLTINDTNNVTVAGGPLNVAGTLALTAGRLFTSMSNLVTVTNTAVAAVTGGTATSNIQGPLKRTLPVSLTTPSVYTFPIGKGGAFSLLEMVNPGTSAGGTVEVLADVVNGPTGGIPDGSTISTLSSSRYWQILLTGGAANLDSTQIRLTENNLIGVNRIGYSNTLGGVYSAVSGGPLAGKISTGKLINGSIEGFYSIGETIIPISGTFHVGASKMSPDYTTITAAMTDIGTKQLQGNIELLLDADYTSSMETFPIIFQQFATNSPAWTIKIRPDAGVTTSITGSSSASIIRFVNGASNYEIDGSNNGTNSRNLTISNTYSSASHAVIWMQGTVAGQGVKNTAIKNAYIKGGSRDYAFGVLIGGTSLSIASGGLGYSNVRLFNNQIYNSNYGVVISGTSSTDKVNGIRLDSNQIGTDSASFYNQVYGIYAYCADSVTISRNQIFNVRTTVSQNNAGIFYDANVSNSVIKGNTIAKIYSTSSSGYGAYGINFGTATGIERDSIYNNSIYDLKTYNYSTTTTTYNAFGIRMMGGAGIKMYFNSVNMSGQVFTPGSASASAALLLLAGSYTDVDIRNNVFVNTMTGSYVGSKSYAVWTTLAGPVSGAVFNNNNFFTSGSYGVLMNGNGTDITTLADLRTATGANANSVNVNPRFTSDSSLSTGLGILGGLGSVVSTITRDILDTLRANPPSIGAFEKGVDASGPEITYTKIINPSVVTNYVLTNFATITDPSLVNTTPGTKPRIYYKKKSEANAFGSYPADNSFSFNGWKYAEASNATSPFSFTIDYSLLSSGFVTLGDTIQYFVAAQDQSAPVSFVSANPSAGFTAADVNTVTAAPSVPEYFVIVSSPMNGPYDVGALGAYTTLSAAVADVVSRGVSGPVTFNLTDAAYASPAETFPITINELTGASAVNTLTIKPAPGVDAVITGTAAAGIFKLNGADYVKIDGSNSGTNSRNLKIQNLSTTGPVIHIAGLGVNLGARRDTIANVTIVGGGKANNENCNGIFIGGAALGTGASYNDSIGIVNDSIYNVYAAVRSIGVALVKTTGLYIAGNVFGNAIPSSSIEFFGAHVSNATGAVIARNTIVNVQTPVISTNYSALDPRPSGVVVDGCENTLISKNKISAIRYTGSDGGGGKGIDVFNTLNTNITVSNNTISDISGDGDAGDPSDVTPAYLRTYNSHGIILQGGNNHKVYYNTVNMNSARILGDYDNGISSCLFVESPSSTGLDVRNNIFQNTMGSANVLAPGNNYGIYSVNSSANYTQLNNNDYFVSSPTAGVINSVGYYMTADVTTLAAWKSATGKEVNSGNDSVSFVSFTDLHLTGTSVGNNVLAGAPLAGFTTDIDGETRGTQFPYMGSDENIVTPLTLPVKLASFKASAMKNNVLLTWSTASEVNNEGFAIERSSDGKEFIRVGYVRGNGSSNALISYRETDYNAFDKAGANTLYYRLRQRDFDGTESLSPVATVTRTGKNLGEPTVYPNPFTDGVTIDVASATAGSYAVSVVDIQGKEVHSMNVSMVVGMNNIQISQLAALRAGIYFVKLTGSETLNIKLVKTN